MLVQKESVTTREALAKALEEQGEIIAGEAVKLVKYAGRKLLKHQT